MPVCSTGSELQPGSPEEITLTTQFMASLLPASLSWLLPYIPYVQVFSVNLVDFCDLEPPADPGLTVEDLINLIKPNNYQLAFLAGQKLAQIVHVYLWYRFCRCIDLDPPTPFTAPSALTPLPALNPPGVVSPGLGGTPCRTDIVELATTEQLFGLSALNTQVPTGATSVLITADLSTVNTNVQLATRFSATSGGTITSEAARILRAPANGAYSQAGALPDVNYTLHTITTGPYWRLAYSTNGSPGAFDDPISARVQMDWYCNGALPGDPGGTFNPCVACPPDPFLTAQLQNLASQLDYMRTQIDLIQRQEVPFAYIEGDSHTGLSGDGSVSIGQVLGYRVDVTDIPSRTGLTDGTPETLFDLGWVRTGFPDGWGPRLNVDAESRVVAPVSAAATRVGYTLSPGVEITITELLREP